MFEDNGNASSAKNTYGTDFVRPGRGV